MFVTNKGEKLPDSNVNVLDYSTTVRLPTNKTTHK